MKSRIWLAVGSIVVCGLAVCGIVYVLSAGTQVETTTAAIGPIEQFIDERAKTRLPETYLITMPFSGRIDSIVSEEGENVLRLKDFNEGTRVNRDDDVARIVPGDLRLAVERTNAEVERLEAAIAENDDASVELTAKDQAFQFVKSMAAAVEAAAARKESGKAKLTYAETDLGRVLKLAASGAKTQDDLDLAKLRKVEAGVDFQQDRLVHAAMLAMQAATNLMPTMVQQYIDRKLLKTKEVLRKQKAEAEVRLKQVLQDQRRGTMKSPVDGVILKRFITNERFLSAGTVLLEIGRLEDLEVEADILSLDVVDARRGNPVLIYGAAIGTRKARGTVHRVYPAGFTKVSSLGVEQQRVKVIIHLDPEDHKRLLAEERLGVGYRVRVRIITASKPRALVVPRSAIFRGPDGGWQLYVVRQRRAQLQKVQVGLINDQQVEITKGLAEGEQVVLAPESSLTDGARVRIKNKTE